MGLKLGAIFKNMIPFFFPAPKPVEEPSDVTCDFRLDSDGWHKHVIKLLKLMEVKCFYIDAPRKTAHVSETKIAKVFGRLHNKKLLGKMLMLLSPDMNDLILSEKFQFDYPIDNPNISDPIMNLVLRLNTSTTLWDKPIMNLISGVDIKKDPYANTAHIRGKKSLLPLLKLIGKAEATDKVKIWWLTYGCDVEIDAYGNFFYKLPKANATSGSNDKPK
ncbi:hypothetical protein COLO4_09768 [Corchorus olitorius]|uniref:Uncharacterized protein n=1 Tax=Corchorus olitorius TaxID=93759 RepID=A0A1R3KB80_9ROSI|nr:hypothetical protein COLO4_09768 [Corchorus olitorius]